LAHLNNMKVDESMIQTVVAVADQYYTDDRSNELYDLLGEKVGGFPSIWFEVGVFALAMDQQLAGEWSIGAREFIDDVMELTRDWITLCLMNGTFVTFDHLWDTRLERFKVVVESTTTLTHTVWPLAPRGDVSQARALALKEVRDTCGALANLRVVEVKRAAGRP